MQIVGVDYRVVRWPIAPRGAARGKWTERTSVIVTVRDESGVTGLGEAAPLPGLSIDHVDDAVRACEALAARVPFTLEVPVHATALADRITLAPAARFAIETALLSALAQRTGTSIASMLAPLARPPRESNPNVLASVPLAELRNNAVVDDEQEAIAAVGAGAPCLKIKTPSPGDLERVRRIARAVPDVPLRLDANRGWPRADVRTLLASVAHLPIEYVEEPCPDAHALLVEPLLVKIALDESLVELSPAEVTRALESPHLGALVLKPTLLGGYVRCLELAAAAHAHGIAPVVTHMLEGAVGTAACRELARAIGADVVVGLAPHDSEHSFVTGLRDSALSAEHRDHSGAGASHMQLDCISSAPPDRSADQPHQLARPTSHMPLEYISSGEPDQLVAPANQSARPTNQPTRPTNHMQLDCISADVPSRSKPTIIFATPSQETVDAIRRAFEQRQPIALIHHKATVDEIARQRSLINAATFTADDAVVLFTSGSTGPSRGVVLSRQALIANAEASSARLGWRADDRWLVCLPLAHAGGLSVVIRCLLARKQVVLGDVCDIDQVTLASLVPAQLAQLLDDRAWRPSPQLRAVLLGGAAAPPALIAAALDRGVPVLPTYGLTETFGQVATARESGGRPVPLPGVELIAGTRARPAPIRIRGAMLASRYLDGTPIAPELVTADLGFFERDELHVLGRADDVIISGGENIHPTQVEAVLAATPGVRSAAAFGVADPRWGQIVAAAITTEPGFDRSRALDFWHAQLPPHARPRLLALVGELPRLPSGKIDRLRVAAVPTSPIEYGH